MKTRPVYRSLNKLMTLLGVERKLFFFILITSFCLFQISKALLPAVVVFVAFWIVAKAATQADPQLFRILLTASRFAARYDPARPQKGGNGRGLTPIPVQELPGE